MRVTIIGTGYVGLTTGVALAYIGHRVTGVDKDPRKLALLNAGEPPIHEPHLAPLFGQARSRMCFTDNTEEAVQGADMVLIAVGTPPLGNGEANTRYVEQAAVEAAAGIQPDQRCAFVVKSTVPVGTNRRVSRSVERVLAARGVRADVSFASNPEFLRQGEALSDALYPERIVAGSDDPEAIEALRCLYEPLLDQGFCPPEGLPRPAGLPRPMFITTDATSAEMIKYAANAFLALKISYINEMAGLCERVGADVTAVARGIGSDSRIGHAFLNAGLGWGGSCFPKDTSSLIAVAAQYNYTMPTVQAAREVNARQRQAVVDKLQGALKVLRGRLITVLGLSFKPNTDDTRESPALDIIRSLTALGAHVRVHDPVVRLPDGALDSMEVEVMTDPCEALDGADGVVIATRWPEYHRLDLRRMATCMRQPVMVDGVNLYEPESAVAAGFQYIGMGR